jgi:hypothetical protein
VLDRRKSEDLSELQSKWFQIYKSILEHPPRKHAKCCCSCSKLQAAPATIFNWSNLFLIPFFCDPVSGLRMTRPRAWPAKNTCGGPSLWSATDFLSPMIEPSSD